MKKIIFILIFILLLTSCRDNPQIEQSNKEASSVPSNNQAPLSEENINSRIRSNLDILAKSEPDDVVSEAEGIINDKLFDEIVAFGEDALPFLEQISDRSNEDISGYEDPNANIEQRIWAVNAIYAIKPEKYDRFFPSPDGKYTVKLPIDSFHSFFNHGSSFYYIHIIDNVTKKIIFTTDMEKVYSIGGLFFPEVNWSPDSNFAIIDCCGRRSGSVMAIDIQDKSYTCLPGKEEAIEHVFPGENIEEILSVPRCWFSFDSWESDKVVKINYNVSVINDEKDFKGWYTYDLSKRKTVKLEYSFDYYE